MGRHKVVSLGSLDPVLILGPERYDPRRYNGNVNLTVADIACISREQIHPGKDNSKMRYLVFDTGDAHEGLIMTNKEPVSLKEIGSTKKIIRHGDVIISRLRPYLRQIAYVDYQIAGLTADVSLACSTEFYVLRSNDNRSIAFLAPYLLSAPIQEILCASQEGGHHPRFNQKSLEMLPLPDWLIVDRDRISQSFELAINSMRDADLAIRMLITKCTELQKATT